MVCPWSTGTWSELLISLFLSQVVELAAENTDKEIFVSTGTSTYLGFELVKCYANVCVFVYTARVWGGAA